MHGLTQRGGLLTLQYNFTSGSVPVSLKRREATMATVKVTDATFRSDVVGASGPVVVDFWAEWCGPCKMIGPALEEISDELEGQVKIVKLNVDENPGVAGAYGIRTIPTLMIFKGGKMATSKIGAAPKGELKKWIADAL
jgi:thioredoxin 1